MVMLEDKCVTAVSELEGTEVCLCAHIKVCHKRV